MPHFHSYLHHGATCCKHGVCNQNEIISIELGWELVEIAAGLAAATNDIARKTH
jgi:hypothetical protein